MEFSYLEESGMVNKYRLHSRDYIESLSEIDKGIYNSDYIENKVHGESEKSKRLNEIRFSFLSGFLGDGSARTILDIGYGNGSFLEYLVKKRKELDSFVAIRGYDVSNENGVDPYRGKELLKEVGILPNLRDFKHDIITMFDVLEHVNNPKQFILDTKANVYIITIPLLHFEWTTEEDLMDIDGKFRNWKHRKPGEHYHFWTESGLRHLFESCGYDCFDQSYDENEVRVTTQMDYPERNVFSGIYVKRTIWS